MVGGTPRYLPPAKVPTLTNIPTPQPGQDGQRGSPRYLPPSQGTYPPQQVRMGEGYPKVPTPPGQGTYPLPGQDGGYPKVPTPLPPRTCYTVCLLRSRRRTFLFVFLSSHLCIFRLLKRLSPLFVYTQQTELGASYYALNSCVSSFPIWATYCITFVIIKLRCLMSDSKICCVQDLLRSFEISYM